MSADTSFLKVLVVLVLGAFFVTSATLNETWQHSNVTPAESAVATQQETNFH